jgi:lysophospholipase L1-like esterase
MDRKRNTAILIAVAFALAMASGAGASTINQNTSWTITKSGATQTYRVVGYGDSIYAGYRGSIFSVAKRAAPYVDGEYAGNVWNQNVQIVRRAKSGAVASDVYNNKIVAERSYMQATNTRIVTFEMCGNDYLQARSNFNGQTGTCNPTPGNNALANCTNYTGLAMNAINQYATTATAKIVSNLYYPGYDADNANSSCRDSVTGQPINKQSNNLKLLATSNWRTCNLAEQRGFFCADSFAQYMGADYDSNSDGQIDSDALRYVQGESENDYVTRITTTLRSTIRDANTHFVNGSTSYDYILSDNTHPTYFGGTQSSGGSGSGPADGGTIVGGKNPQWNRFGHERMGWALSVYNPATP